MRPSRAGQGHIKTGCPVPGANRRRSARVQLHDLLAAPAKAGAALAPCALPATEVRKSPTPLAVGNTFAIVCFDADQSPLAMRRRLLQAAALTGAGGVGARHCPSRLSRTTFELGLVSIQPAAETATRHRSTPLAAPRREAGQASMSGRSRRASVSFCRDFDSGKKFGRSCDQLHPAFHLFIDGVEQVGFAGLQVGGTLRNKPDLYTGDRVRNSWEARSTNSLRTRSKARCSVTSMRLSSTAQGGLQAG